MQVPETQYSGRGWMKDVEESAPRVSDRGRRRCGRRGYRTGRPPCQLSTDPPPAFATRPVCPPIPLTRTPAPCQPRGSLLTADYAHQAHRACVQCQQASSPMSGAATTDGCTMPIDSFTLSTSLLLPPHRMHPELTLPARGRAGRMRALRTQRPRGGGSRGVRRVGLASREPRVACTCAPPGLVSLHEPDDCASFARRMSLAPYRTTDQVTGRTAFDGDVSFGRLFELETRTRAAHGDRLETSWYLHRTPIWVVSAGGFERNRACRWVYAENPPLSLIIYV
ncbi:hypothetical protein BC628DRAFT_1389147 [Trametes gibbosa]|nr:hypothetical protein BC628DRAFT_1389147 [Trametes gibbosa]